jgi:hypothetical protein
MPHGNVCGMIYLADRCIDVMRPYSGLLLEYKETTTFSTADTILLNGLSLNSTFESFVKSCRQISVLFKIGY